MYIFFFLSEIARKIVLPKFLGRNMASVIRGNSGQPYAMVTTRAASAVVVVSSETAALVMRRRSQRRTVDPDRKSVV